MDKSLIKHRVKQAYRNAESNPDFMNTFKAGIQDVIDSFVPGEVTHPWHVNRDIDHLSEISKTRGYKAKGYLMLIVNYIAMIIEAYEKGEDSINFEGQFDIFNEKTSINDEKE